MDLQAKSYDDLMAEPCDNCSTRKPITVESDDMNRRNSSDRPAVLKAAFKEQTYYARGIELREARVKAKAMRMQWVEEALLDLMIECPTCRLMDRLTDDDHGI